MNRNDDRVTRAQRRRMDPELEEQDEFTAPPPRRRRSQAARIRGEGDMEDTLVPPSKESLDNERQYGRPKAAAPQRSARKAIDLYDDEKDADDDFEEGSALYDDEEDEGRERKGKRPMVRWIIIGAVILALLAGITFVSINHPDLVDSVVRWGSELINGPTPSPEPTPEPTPVPTPIPTPAPDASMAKVIELEASPVQQPDINLPISFQVTTTEQTNRVRIVDSNGQILIEGLENDYTDVDYGRLWNLTVYFLNPYEGNVEAYPGNEAGWNEANSSVIAIKVGDPQAEPTPAPYIEEPTEAGADPGQTGSAAALVLSSSVADATAVDVTGVIVINKEPVEAFARESFINMGDADEYRGENGMNGVHTFRGSSMRQNSAFGVANATENKLEGVWTANAGTEDDGHGTFGKQPLIVQWHADIRKLMPMYEDKLNKNLLKEVVFASNDGNLYFLDAEDGKPTRDPLPIDPVMPMYGAASVYSQGYPLVAVGSGDPANPNPNTDTGLFVYNLLTMKKAVEIRSSNRVEAVSEDKSYITSPLIDNETGTLLSVGGNGLLYTMTLSPSFSRETGTLTVAPTLESYAATADTADMSVDSALAAYGENVYYTTNGGVLQSVNMNTLQTQWALNLGVDTDAAIALDVDAAGMGAVALYTASRADAKGLTHMRRIDADTGEIVWDITAQGSCSASPVVGQDGIGALVLFTVSGADTATVYALDKDTGEAVWEYTLESDTMASPMAMYDESGNAWIVQGDNTGLHLINGTTGERLDKMNASSPVIGSPAAFDNMIVVTTQNGKIHGIMLR